MNNVINHVPYLRSSRQFPDNLHQICTEMNKAYIDIANAVNNRTISIFTSNNPVVTGESWFVTSRREQSFRQIYTFGTINPGTELDIPTNIKTNVTSFTRIYGTVVTENGSLGKPDYRPLPYVDPASLSTSMTILVGDAVISGPPTQCIRIVLGATAPKVTSGIAVLEWLPNL